MKGSFLLNSNGGQSIFGSSAGEAGGRLSIRTEETSFSSVHLNLPDGSEEMEECPTVACRSTATRIKPVKHRVQKGSMAKRGLA